MSTGVLYFSDILKTVNRQPTLKRGFIVDTSILFAYAYPNDYFNKQSTDLFDYLSELEIPLYINANIRSEFINNYFHSVVLGLVKKNRGLWSIIVKPVFQSSVPYFKIKS